MGTGTSEGVPRVSCLTESPVTCKTCNDAVRVGSKNRRRNCSLLLRAKNRETDNQTHIVIDVGKFFYESALAWFPKYQLRNIDAVLLTHEVSITSTLFEVVSSYWIGKACGSREWIR